jgi:hypothetical protein
MPSSSVHAALPSARATPRHAAPSWAATLNSRGALREQLWAVPTLCRQAVSWGTSGFSPLSFDLFLYFLIIFKSLQIQKFI